METEFQVKKATLVEYKKPQIVASKNPKWIGGIITKKDGRIMIYCPGHPSATSGRYVYRYRLVVEKIAGRYLSPSEIVHHKNGIVNDDRPENLEVTNNRLHMLGHNLLSLRGKWAKQWDKCVLCGTIERKHKGHGLCSRCSNRKRWPEKYKRQKERQKQ